MALGREAFGGCWGVGGAAMEGLVPFIIQHPLELCGLSHPTEHDEQLRSGPGPSPERPAPGSGTSGLQSRGKHISVACKTHTRVNCGVLLAA